MGSLVFLGLERSTPSTLAWNPVLAPRDVQRWGRELPYEPGRWRNIGMRHVGRHVHTPQATRMRLMDTLLQSGLPVQSYGGCRNNQNEVWRQQGVRLQHIRNNQNAAAKLALDACTRHRIMLAAESRNCPGWAAWNLEHALRD